MSAPMLALRWSTAAAPHGIVSVGTTSNSTANFPPPYPELKVRMLKAEALKALLYVCVAWTMLKKHYAKLRTVHHDLLLRVNGVCKKSTDHGLSYRAALETTG